MQHLDRQDLYRGFLELIRSNAEKERRAVHRRMLSVVFWCFLLPAAVSLVFLLLIHLQAVPLKWRGLLDWVFLIFPVSYSIYFLSVEVLRELPNAFRRGGLANLLAQAGRDSEWRKSVSAEMKRALSATPEDWAWLVRSYRIDLESIRHRARHMTILAGAVFFLIMQGIDSLASGPSEEVGWFKHPVFGWVEAAQPKDLSQFVGLGLFLVLLHLSGTQNHQDLRRYLGCAELISLDLSQRADA